MFNDLWLRYPVFNEDQTKRDFGQPLAEISTYKTGRCLITWRTKPTLTATHAPQYQLSDWAPTRYLLSVSSVFSLGTFWLLRHECEAFQARTSIHSTNKTKGDTLILTVIAKNEKEHPNKAILLEILFSWKLIELYTWQVKLLHLRHRGVGSQSHKRVIRSN